MTKKIITVVIPVYNVEKYLEKCLNSFCLPELSDLLEVLIINDGSCDSSLAISTKYARAYPSIFYIISKENGGHGSAINTGIRNASGKYLKVVDGDDWVDKAAFSHLVSILRTSSCDIVASRYSWVDDCSRKARVPKHQMPLGCKAGKPYLFDTSITHSFIKMHNFTIRTQILKEHCPPIDEHCFYVDNEFILFPIPYVKSISWIPDIVYMYRVGMASQSVNLVTMQKRVLQHEKVLLRLLDYYDHVSPCISRLKTREYLASGIAKMLCSQIKIYLSFFPATLYKNKIRALETRIKKNQPQIYASVTNPYVWLLRLSDYKLYYLASYMLRKCQGII